MTQAIKIREVPYRTKTIEVYSDGTCEFSGKEFAGKDVEEAIWKAKYWIDALLSTRIITNLRRNSDQQNELSTKT